MPDRTTEIIDRAISRLRSRGQRLTPPRRAVIEVLAGDADHPDAEQVVALVARYDDTAHRATVYRTLETLTRLGIVRHIHSGHGPTAFHLADDLLTEDPAGMRTHLHARCSSCGLVVDLAADVLDDATSRLLALGLTLQAGHVALPVTCGSCHRDL